MSLAFSDGNNNRAVCLPKSRNFVHINKCEIKSWLVYGRHYVKIGTIPNERIAFHNEEDLEYFHQVVEK